MKSKYHITIILIAVLVAFYFYFENKKRRVIKIAIGKRDVDSSCLESKQVESERVENKPPKVDEEDYLEIDKIELSSVGEDKNADVYLEDDINANPDLDDIYPKNENFSDDYGVSNTVDNKFLMVINGN